MEGGKIRGRGKAKGRVMDIYGRVRAGRLRFSYRRGCNHVLIEAGDPTDGDSEGPSLR